MKPNNKAYVLSETIKDQFVSAIYKLRITRKAEYRVIWRFSYDKVKSVSVQDRYTKNIKRYYFSEEV